VDGNSDIGLGHVVRCCALAEMLKDNFDCYFYLRKPSKEITEEVSKYSVSVYELPNNISYEKEGKEWIDLLQGNEIVVLDGYNFNTAYQKAIKSKGCKLVCIDDIYQYHFVADVVINHAPCISKNSYFCEPYTKLCLGTEYVLLKNHFLKKASGAEKKLELTASPIFICLGGADPKNKTLNIVDEVRKLFPSKKIIVVVGAAYSKRVSLEEYCIKNRNLTLLVDISSEDLMCMMEEAHIAVTSASTVALEYVCVKGNLFLLQTADNQVHLYKSLIEKKCAYPFELLNDNYTCCSNIQNQYALIDGKSDKRILEIFSRL
jgi:UDP-2,4-diacetamido-2,4,6-trideoxy-beta-L-altropyranose hydrolase